MSQPAGAKQLTERDVDVLECVGRAGVASVGQVAQRFWPGRRLRTAEERIRRLARAGYVEVHACHFRRPGEPVLCLTEVGQKQFTTAERDRLQVGLPSSAEIRQQLMVQDARSLIEKKVLDSGGEIAEWLYERDVRAEMRRKWSREQRRGLQQLRLDIPDARVTIRTAAGDVEILDVEVDGAYYGKMLCRKAKCLSKSGRQVVWVCTPQRAAYLQQALAEYPNIWVLTIHSP